MHKRISGWISLCLVICVGLIHGLVYVFIVPPWQHNEEPNHFEYAWLAAHYSAFPKVTDYDPLMSRAVMKSMVKNHFFDGMEYFPDLSSPQPIPIIGFSQLSDPPLYYLIASIPLRLLQFVYPKASIETQLYVARLTSLGFLLVALLACWGLVRELTGEANPIRWLAPLSLALWPGFIDLMSAVTNVACAVAFFSLFIWFGVRLIRRGLGWLDGLAAILSVAGYLWTIPMGYIIAPLSGLVFLFAIFRNRWRWVSWVVIFLGTCAGILALLTWGDADLWYRETWQVESTSTIQQSAPIGERAIQLSVASQWPPNRVFQLIQRENVRELGGKTIIFGAWVWAERSLEAVSLVMQTDQDDNSISRLISVTETPSFHAITTTLSVNIKRAWIILSAPTRAADSNVKVYFDGVVLAEGSFPLEESPEFADQTAGSGVWGGKPFTNLVRNPSAERIGFRIRLWADARQILGSYGRISMVLYVARDWSNTAWYFHSTGANLLRTMWGKFGWNHVPFLGHKPYRVFLAATLMGMVGAMVAVWRFRKTLPWTLLVWLCFSVIGIISMTVLRGIFNIWFNIFIPSARYFFPVMPVIVFILCTGWWEILGNISRWLRPWVPRLFMCFFFWGLVRTPS